MYISTARLITTGCIVGGCLWIHFKSTKPDNRDGAWWGLLWFIFALGAGSLIFDD